MFVCMYMNGSDINSEAETLLVSCYGSLTGHFYVVVCDFFFGQLLPTFSSGGGWRQALVIHLENLKKQLRPLAMVIERETIFFQFCCRCCYTLDKFACGHHKSECNIFLT